MPDRRAFRVNETPSPNLLDVTRPRTEQVERRCSEARGDGEADTQQQPIRPEPKRTHEQYEQGFGVGEEGNAYEKSCLQSLSASPEVDSKQVRNQHDGVGREGDNRRGQIKGREKCEEEGSGEGFGLRPPQVREPVTNGASSENARGIEQP